MKLNECRRGCGVTKANGGKFLGVTKATWQCPAIKAEVSGKES